eukprot:m.638928 g.638928  ORF g.638928 m.638928 type:complete len:148 (+) comp58331_c0_seq9:140-583(+)
MLPLLSAFDRLSFVFSCSCSFSSSLTHDTRLQTLRTCSRSGCLNMVAAALRVTVLLLGLAALSAHAQLTPYQRVPSYLDIGGIATFSIDDTPYLAIPDTTYIDPTSDDVIINIICEDYIDCYIPSKLYQWDATTQQFEFFQNLVAAR